MSSLAYPNEAKILLEMLAQDQVEKKAYGAAYWSEAEPKTLSGMQADLSLQSCKRAKRALEIMQQVGLPSISNLGREAAQALSVLAIHTKLDVLKQVLAAFVASDELNHEDTYYQAIPSMVDWVLINERKPQRFGTQWLFNEDKYPFLPTVEDFEYVNKRRAKYGIEPLRWPKSLAIPLEEQPWLARPLSELVMREPSEDEYSQLEQ